MKTLFAMQLSNWLRDSSAAQPQLLDVREPWELERCRLDNVISIPLGQLPARIGELDPQRPLVCICHHGMRSMNAAAWLERNGFADIYNLTGGVAAWSSDVDPAFPTY